MDQQIKVTVEQLKPNKEGKDMWVQLFQKISTIAAPKVIELAIEKAPKVLDSVVETAKVYNPMRSYDNFEFTQYHYDIIVRDYNYVMRHNANLGENDERKYLYQVVEHLNKEWGINKSFPTYSRIWNDKDGILRRGMQPGNPFKPGRTIK